MNFWVGTTAVLTTDVYLTDTLQFYVRYLRDNGAGPIPLFVIHLRPCKHGTHTLRLAVLVRSAATNKWLRHPCAGCTFVRTSATSIDSGNNRRTSAPPLVPFASLFSGSTLPLLSHVACTVRQDLLRSVLCRYSSAGRRCLSRCSTAVLRTCVRMVPVLLLFA